MPTFTTVDAAWTPSPTTFDDAEARRFDTAMFLGDGTANGVRGGVVRHGDTSLAVTVNGSDQVTVQPGAFVIPAATGLGVYRGALSAAVGPTAGTALASRNATNPRIDLVVIQATSTGAVVKTIDGTPSSSPSAPALPAQHIEVARLIVPQVGGGAVTVDSSWRQYATALGGDLYVETSARLSGSGNQKGQRAVALDTGIDYRWSGTAWVAQFADWVECAYRPNFAGAGEATVVARRNGMVTLSLGLTYTAGTWAAGAWAFTVPAGFIPSRTINFCATANDYVTLRNMAIQSDGAAVIRATGSGIIVGTVTYPVAL